MKQGSADVNKKHWISRMSSDANLRICCAICWLNCNSSTGWMLKWESIDVMEYWNHKNSNFRSTKPHGHKNAKQFYNLNFFFIDYIHSHGCARWGASGALFPKSASCGAESPLKGLNLGAYKSSWSAAAQQTVTNLVRSGRKQR